MDFFTHVFHILGESPLGNYIFPVLHNQYTSLPHTSISGVWLSSSGHAILRHGSGTNTKMLSNRNLFEAREYDLIFVKWEKQHKLRLSLFLKHFYPCNDLIIQLHCMISFDAIPTVHMSTHRKGYKKLSELHHCTLNSKVLTVQSRIF